MPHLNLRDIPEEAPKTETVHMKIAGRDVMEVRTNTNGIVYLNLFFDISDFTLDELRLLSVLTGAFGELGTKNYSAQELQNEIKAKLGGISAKIEVTAKQGTVSSCTPFLVVSASMLEENTEDAVALISEILINGRCDEAERLYEILLQLDYFTKQGLIAEGHMFAVRKALSASSKEGALKEQLEGESFIRWFSPFVETFMEHSEETIRLFGKIREKTFAKNRLFVGYSGNLNDKTMEDLINALPETNINSVAEMTAFDSNNCTIEIPASVGFSACGHNLYALGGEFTGACSVLSHLVTYVYLWNMVRVQGGAYGTGMNVSANGDVFCYSYRDPDIPNTMAACSGIPDFLEDFLAQGMPLDDIIIGTVNKTDPLLDPAGVCAMACTRHLRGYDP